MRVARSLAIALMAKKRQHVPHRGRRLRENDNLERQWPRSRAHLALVIELRANEETQNRPSSVITPLSRYVNRALVWNPRPKMGSVVGGAKNTEMVALKRHRAHHCRSCL